MSTEPKAMDERARWALEKATHALIDELGERNSIDARDCIRRLVHGFGLEFVQRHVERAKQVQAEGGLPRPEGGLRSLGGVFFVVMKESVGLESYLQVSLTRQHRLRLRRERSGWRPAQQAKAETGQQAGAAQTSEQDAT
jgi:hypothetical protein